MARLLNRRSGRHLTFARPWTSQPPRRTVARYHPRGRPWRNRIRPGRATRLVGSPAEPTGPDPSPRPTAVKGGSTALGPPPETSGRARWPPRETEQGDHRLPDHSVGVAERRPGREVRPAPALAARSRSVGRRSGRRVATPARRHRRRRQRPAPRRSTPPRRPRSGRTRPLAGSAPWGERRFGSTRPFPPAADPRVPAPPGRATDRARARYRRIEVAPADRPAHAMSGFATGRRPVGRRSVDRSARPTLSPPRLRWIAAPPWPLPPGRSNGAGTDRHAG